MKTTFYVLKCVYETIAPMENYKPFGKMILNKQMCYLNCCIQ